MGIIMSFNKWYRLEREETQNELRMEKESGGKQV